MDLTDLTGDLDFRGTQVGAFCDLIARTQPVQTFGLDRLRSAERVQRREGASLWKVTLGGGRGTVTVPIAGLDGGAE